MKLQVLAACAALVSLSAGSALADSVTAKLAQPVAQKVKFIAGGAIFNCEADACVANAPSSQTFAVSTCKTIADKVGVVAAFEGSKSLDDGRLAQCNAKAVAKAGASTTLAKQ